MCGIVGYVGSEPAAKVLLAWLPPEELTPYLSNITYTKFTDTTITS